MLTKAQAQTYGGIRVKFENYNSTTGRYGYFVQDVLPFDHYPWGVCLEEAYENEGLTPTEGEIITEAVHAWNIAYRDYVRKVLGKSVWQLSNFPNNLFTISCNSSYHNIIYIEISNFHNYSETWGEGIIKDAQYTAVDYWINQFFGIVEIDISQRIYWDKKEYFVTIAHELGHALGIGHHNYAGIMYNYGCRIEEACYLGRFEIIEFFKNYFRNPLTLKGRR